MSLRRITGLLALRRLFGGSGYEKPQSALCAFVRFCLRHILGACKNKGLWNGLPLFLPIRRPKRRQQPGRYATYDLHNYNFYYKMLISNLLKGYNYENIICFTIIITIKLQE